MIKLIVALFFAALASVSSAQTMDDEISYLIDQIGKEGCAFVRNDRRYLGRNARAHLRSKWSNNEHLVNSTEDFVVKLASTSATTGAPYIIQCRGEEDQNAYAWFTALLSNYRAERD